MNTQNEDNNMNNIKMHYKMYKAGKFWVFSASALAMLVGSSVIMTQQVSANTVDQQHSLSYLPDSRQYDDIIPANTSVQSNSLAADSLVGVTIFENTEAGNNSNTAQDGNKIKTDTGKQNVDFTVKGVQGLSVELIGTGNNKKAVLKIPKELEGRVKANGMATIKGSFSVRLDKVPLLSSQLQGVTNSLSALGDGLDKVVNVVNGPAGKLAGLQIDTNIKEISDNIRDTLNSVQTFDQGEFQGEIKSYTDPVTGEEFMYVDVDAGVGAILKQSLTEQLDDLIKTLDNIHLNVTGRGIGGAIGGTLNPVLDAVTQTLIPGVTGALKALAQPIINGGGDLISELANASALGHIEVTMPTTIDTGGLDANKLTNGTAEFELDVNASKAIDVPLFTNTASKTNIYFEQNLDKLKTDAKAEIDGLGNLTDQQKTDYKNKVDAATAVDAINAILVEARAVDNTPKPDDLAEAKANAKAEIDGLGNLTDQQKADYKNKVDAATSVDAVNAILVEARAVDNTPKPDDLAEAKANAKAEIDGLGNLTDQQKADYKNKVDAATSVDAVNAILVEARAVDNTPKPDELAQAKADAKAEIDGLGNLTDQQKTDYKNKVDAATSVDAVNAILVEARAVDNTPKPDELAHAKEDAKAEIDGLGNLTDQQKTDYKNKVDAATSVDAVNAILVEARAVDNTPKPDDLAEAKTNAKSEIDGLGNLTDQQKADYKNKVDAATSVDAINAILVEARAVDNTPKPDDLAHAKDAAKSEIDDLKNLDQDAKNGFKDQIDKAEKTDDVNQVLEDAKKADNDAKLKAEEEALNKAKEDAKSEIDDLNNLTDDEKKDLKDQIDGATKLEDIDGIVETGKKTDAENKAKAEQDALNKAKEDAKSEIDDLKNLDQDAKDTFKDQVDSAEKQKDIDAIVEDAKELDRIEQEKKQKLPVVNLLIVADGKVVLEQKDFFQTLDVSVIIKNNKQLERWIRVWAFLNGYRLNDIQINKLATQYLALLDGILGNDDDTFDFENGEVYDVVANVSVGQEPNPDEQNPDENGGSKPDENGGSKPDENGGSKPDENGGSKPDENGGSKPDENGGSKPDENGGSKPDENGGSKPNENGGSKPDENGGSKPDENGGSKPDENGGSKPDENGGSKPDENGGSKPDENGGSKPDENGGNKLDQNNSNVDGQGNKLDNTVNKTQTGDKHAKQVIDSQNGKDSDLPNTSSQETNNLWGILGLSFVIGLFGWATRKKHR